MPTISYQGRAVALVGPSRDFIVPTIANRAEGDPLRQFILRLIAYAREAQAGRLPGEPGRYLPSRAEQYVRATLLPEDRFRRLAGLTDEALATTFAVPIEQIVERRAELQRSVNVGGNSRTRRHTGGSPCRGATRRIF